MAYCEFAIMCLGSAFLNKIRKKKQKKYMYIIICFFTILFMGGTLGYQADYEIYSLMYSGMYPMNKIEVLFSLSMKLGNLLGLSYEWFSFYFIAAGVILLFYIAYKFIGYSSEFLIFYITSLMFLNIVQIRNFLSMTFCLVAFFCLFYAKKREKILFVFFVLVATGFQLTAILYLPIIFFDKFKQRKYMFYFLGVVLAISFAISFVPSILTYILRSSILASIDNRVMRYTVGMVRIGYLINWAMLLMNVFIAYICKKIYKETKNTCENQKAIPKIYKITLIMLMYFPLFRINSEFYRIIMNFLPILCMGYILTIRRFKDNFKRKSKRNFELSLLFWSYIIVVIILKVVYPHWNDVVLITFSSRKFWF